MSSPTLRMGFRAFSSSCYRSSFPVLLLRSCSPFEKGYRKKKEKRANCENCVSPWKLERSGETTTRINPDGHGRSEQLCVCPGEKKKGSAESIGSFFS